MNMKISLIRAAMGSLLLGGFLHSSFAQNTEQNSAQDFVQDLGSSVVQAEGPTHAILDGLREDDDLKGDRLEREISTTIAETIKNEPDVAIRSMGPAAARPVIKGLSGSHVELTEDGSFCGDMSATSPDHAVASEVLTAHRLRVLRGPHILAHSLAIHFLTERLFTAMSRSIPKAHNRGTQRPWEQTRRLRAFR